MASIDINKLIQESMATTIVKDDTTGAAPVVDDLHDSMKSVVEADLAKAGEYLRDPKKLHDDTVADAKKTVTIKGGKVVKSDDLGEKIKSGFGVAKKVVGDAIQNTNPKLAAAGAAGAAGLVGAGVMAKKYLASRKKK